MSAPTATCGRCGNDVAADDIFCPYCNHKLPEFAMAMQQKVDTEQAGDEGERIRVPRPLRIPWRVLTVGSVLALVVTAIVAVAADDDGSPPPPVLAEMRSRPAQQWTRPIDGMFLDHLVDDDRVFTFSRAGQRFVVSALETSTGRLRWTSELDASSRVGAVDDARIVGALGLVGENVAIVFGSAGDEYRDVFVLDGTTGTERWRVDVDVNASDVVGPGVITSPTTDGEVAVRVIDDVQRRVGERLTLRQLFVVDGAAFADDGETLRGLAPGAVSAFEFAHHDDSVSAAAEADGGLALGVDDRVVSVSAVGARRWSVNVRVGDVRAVTAMSDQRLLVTGVDGTRVISAADGSDIVSDAADFAQAVAAAGPNGQDVLFAFSDDSSITVLAAVDDRFVRVAELDGFTVPLVQSSGRVAYVTEGQRADDFERSLVAFELPGGRKLWSMPLGIDDDTLVTVDGLLVVSTGTNPMLAFYRPA